MWDVYMEDGHVLLCHSICQAGQRSLVEALEEVRTFLDSHPENVITIIFESYVEHSILVRAFEDRPNPTRKFRILMENGQRL